MSQQEAVLKISVDIDNLNDVQKLEKELEKLKKTAQSVKSSSKGIGSVVGGSGGGSSGAGSVLGTVSKVFSSLQNGIGGLTRGLSMALTDVLGPAGPILGAVVGVAGKIGSLLGNLFKTFLEGVVEMGKAVAGFLKDSVQAYAEIADIKQTAGVVIEQKNLKGPQGQTGDQANDYMFEQLKSMSKATGQDYKVMSQGALDAINKLGATSIQDALDTVSLANDISASTGRTKSVEQVINAMVNSSIGNNKMLVGMGGLQSDTILGMSKDGKTLSGQKGARWNDIKKWYQDPNNNVVGMAQKTFGSFKDQQTAIKQNFETLKTTLGEAISNLLAPEDGGGIMSIIAGGLDDLDSKISQIDLSAFEKPLQQVTSFVEIMFKKLTGISQEDLQSKVDAFAGGLNDFLQKVIPKIEKIINKLIENGPKLASSIGTLADAIVNLVDALANSGWIDTLANIISKIANEIKYWSSVFNGDESERQQKLVNDINNSGDAGTQDDTVIGDKTDPNKINPNGNTGNKVTIGGEPDYHYSFGKTSAGNGGAGIQGHTINVHVNGTGDPEHVAKKVVEHINKNLKTVGGL